MSKAVILAWGFAGVGVIDLVWIDASLLPRVVGERDGAEVASAAIVASGGVASGSSTSTSTSTSTAPPFPVRPPPKPANVDVDVDDPTPLAVRFAATGGTTVDPTITADLDAVVARLRTTRLTVVVEGHADARGSRRVNLELSKRRAKAVARELIARGAEPDRVEVRWFGERKPAVVGEGDAAWAANRRAVIAWRGSE